MPYIDGMGVAKQINHCFFSGSKIKSQWLAAAWKGTKGL